MQKITKFVVNGVEYGSIDQMPPEIRRQYLEAMEALRGVGKKDGSNVPLSAAASGVRVEESIVYNGRQYKSRDELPPEVRKLLECESSPGAAGEPDDLVVKTTRTYPPKVHMSTRVSTDADDWPSQSTSGFPRLLVFGLIVVVVILLFLWLSGVKPADLLQHRR